MGKPGNPGKPGLRGPVGPAIDVSKLEESQLRLLRGKRGKRGKRGLQGPPGPPGLPVDNLPVAVMDEIKKNASFTFSAPFLNNCPIKIISDLRLVIPQGCLRTVAPLDGGRDAVHERCIDPPGQKRRDAHHELDRVPAGVIGVHGRRGGNAR